MSRKRANESEAARRRSLVAMGEALGPIPIEWHDPAATATERLAEYERGDAIAVTQRTSQILQDSDSGRKRREHLATWSPQGTAATRKATDDEIRRALEEAQAAGKRGVSNIDQHAATALEMDRSSVGKRRRKMGWKPTD